jgi:hypothetical protein
MNSGQRSVLLLVVAAMVAIGLYPPWTYTSDFEWHGVSEHTIRPAGYRFIASPPPPILNESISPNLRTMGIGVKIDAVRLAAEFATIIVCAAAVLFAAKSRVTPARYSIDSSTQRDGSQ